MSPIKQSLKGYQAEISRSKPETSKDLVEEMQRKAKSRADSWRLKLLADANSVRAQLSGAFLFTFVPFV
jgi:Skp family chaperone for outer membrane proteins